MGRPKLLFLDEPTVGIIPITQQYLRDNRRPEENGMTVLYTTHYMEEADESAIE